MPLINGRFYINPAVGRAIERARADGRLGGSEATHHSEDPHWVTINHRHVLIEERQGAQSKPPRPPKTDALSSRDKSVLEKYYDAVNSMAKA